MNRLSILLLIFLVGCGYNHFEELPVVQAPVWEPTASIDALRPGVQPQTVVVEGVVTSSDSAGNFYRELLVENQAMLRISVRLYDLYALYPRGSTIAVRIEQGARLERAANGILTLELPANFNELGASLHRQPYNMGLLAPIVALDDLVGIPYGATVWVVDCRFAEAGSASFSGEVVVVQEGGRKGKLITSPYAAFAPDALPEGRFDIRAVVVDGVLKISDPATDLIPL